MIKLPFVIKFFVLPIFECSFTQLLLYFVYACTEGSGESVYNPSYAQAHLSLFLPNDDAISTRKFFCAGSNR